MYANGGPLPEDDARHRVVLRPCGYLIPRSNPTPEQRVDDNDWAPLCTYCLQHHPWEDGCTNVDPQVPTEEPQ